MLVYKYVSPDAGITTLETSAIRFSQAEALNDPFEIYPNFKTYKKTLKENICEKLKRNRIEMDVIERQSEIQKVVNINIENYLESIRRESLVLSLTKKRNNLIMWSHYADSHRGFVIGFDSDNSFFHLVTPLRNTTPLTEVKYIENRVNVPPFNAKTITSKQYAEFFLTKSIHWEYEEEFRMLATPVAENIVGEKDGLDIYAFEFPPECIREIILGYRICDQKKKKILRIVENHYPHIELFQAHPSKTHFDLDIEPSEI